MLIADSNLRAAEIRKASRGKRTSRKPDNMSDEAAAFWLSDG